MTGGSHSLSGHPAPLADRVTPYQVFVGLCGGPLAWFVQLCVGYALASQPCFANGSPAIQPSVHLHWTSQAIAAVMLLAVAMAIISFLVSWGAYRRTRHEGGGEHRHLVETGAGRTRFLALWGMLLGSGFAVATAITAVAFILLPRCAG
ncbi:MAG: hypothetical protein JWN43_4376 [Gammaproteobacteria bacterium]|nr:hypothetical protein [Gammaproteobacteria bacterium]